MQRPVCRAIIYLNRHCYQGHNDERDKQFGLWNPFQMMPDETCDKEQIGKAPDRVAMSHMESFGQGEIRDNCQTNESPTDQEPNILAIGQVPHNKCQERGKNQQSDVLCHKPVGISTNWSKILTQGYHTEWSQRKTHKQNRDQAAIETCIQPGSGYPAGLEVQVAEEITRNHHIDVDGYAAEHKHEVRENKVRQRYRTMSTEAIATTHPMCKAVIDHDEKHGYGSQNLKITFPILAHFIFLFHFFRAKIQKKEKIHSYFVFFLLSL